MKWYNSLITKITLMFALAFMGVGAIMYIIHNQIKELELRNVKMYTQAILELSHNKNKHINFKILEDSGYILIKDKKTISKIIKNKKLPLNSMKNSEHAIVKTVEYSGAIYAIIDKNFIFKTPHERKILPKIILPITTIILIIFLYIATIRSILPLYDLRQKVKKLADGNYNINCKSNKKDEIGILSNELNSSIQKIKKLRDSRQLFLRNIMHELKTPITKGKLSCEMIEVSTYREILKNVFRRQEKLLDEFARIERLSANELNIDKKEYLLQDIVDFAVDILTHEKENITFKLTPVSINVDFELFATAIKNLLDNGINYSDDKQVLIESKTNRIIISNNGKELEFPLEKYAQPYFLDSKKARSSRGLGFGLFITIQIIRLHKMKIEYNRQNNRNVFIIDLLRYKT